jgi:mono/diheme cytochrome c family protein
MKNPVPMTKESLRKGKEIYEKQCGMCHGVNGDGKGPTAARLNPKPTNFHEHHQMEMSGCEFFWKILRGRGAMPSYKKELTEEEIWQVINYISTFGKKN